MGRELADPRPTLFASWRFLHLPHDTKRCKLYSSTRIRWCEVLRRLCPHAPVTGLKWRGDRLCFELYHLLHERELPAEVKICTPADSMRMEHADVCSASQSEYKTVRLLTSFALRNFQGPHSHLRCELSMSNVVCRVTTNTKVARYRGQAAFHLLQ